MAAEHPERGYIRLGPLYHFLSFIEDDVQNALSGPETQRALSSWISGNGSQNLQQTVKKFVQDPSSSPDDLLKELTEAGLTKWAESIRDVIAGKASINEVIPDIWRRVFEIWHGVFDI